MTERKPSHDPRALNQEVRDIWDLNADFWDDRMGEGNDFHLRLIGPAQERLLDLRPDELVLDIACGNGQFARRMAQLGARVVASDISERMIEHARARTKESGDRIQFSVLDATEERALMALGERRFDAAVCTMALFDMADIGPLITSLSHLLKIGGRFVFSLLHPCFNSTNGLTRVIEREERDGDLVDRYWIKISEYIRPANYKGLAIRGQPAAQHYFHRPISLLFNTCFDAGFVLDGMEEPVFDLPPNPERPLVWENFRDIPPVLVARMRLLQPRL